MASTQRWCAGTAIWVFVLALAPLASAQEHWVATWAASPQETRAFPFGPPPPATAPPAQPPPGNQPAAPAPPPPVMSFQNQTVRMNVRTSIGGSRLRVELSNVFGTKPLTVGSA